MALSYALVKALGGKGSCNIPELEDMMAKDAITCATKNPELLEGKYLGAVLDSCRIGTMTTCAWPTNFDGLLKLINAWGEVNSWRGDLYHEVPMDEMYEKKFELPWISHDGCPRDEKHSGIMLDAGGRSRCGHKTVKKLRPSFVEGYSVFDHLSQIATGNIYEEEPHEPCGDDLDSVWENYENDMKRFKAEAPVRHVDVCYAIIDEPRFKMPLETALRRMNIHRETKTTYCENSYGDPCEHAFEGSGMCRGYVEPTNMVEFCFGGWTMAHLVEKWKEQGDAPLIATFKEHWPSKENLRICSEP